jgi:hypothetical protein
MLGWAQIAPTVENIMIIYLNRSNFSRQFLIVYFYRQIHIDATLLHPLIFLGSAFILYTAVPLIILK